MTAKDDFKPYGVIYCITNTVNGKKYIGQTTMPLQRRWAAHCSAYGCKAMRSAIEKHGREAFEIRQIDTANNAKDLDTKEVFYINTLRTMVQGVGYNLRDGGGNGKPSEASKQRMSDAKIGTKLTDAHKEKISIALSSVPKTSKHSENVSIAKRGKSLTEEHRAKLLGKRPDFVMSESHKAAVRAAATGSVFSEERRRKISDALRGRVKQPLSAETKAKLSLANKGRVRPIVDRLKISEGRKAAKAARALAAQI